MIVRKHPKMLWVLAFGSLWETFSYYGTQTVLVLYLIHVFHLIQSTSYLLYGAYAAFVFLTPLLGGTIADKWLGAKNTLLIGCILSVTGNLLLMSHVYYLFCLGISATLLGAGLYKGNANHLVGAAYQARDPRKELGFTWLYLATNIGGTLGPLIYGIVIHLFGWNYGFLCSALGILSGSLWVLKNRQSLEISTQPSKRTLILVYLAIFLGCVLLTLPFYKINILNLFIFLMFVVSISYLMFMIKKYFGKERQHLFALVIMGIFGMFFFAVSLQIGTVITLFIQENIQQGTINIKLPASTFSMLYPLFVLLLAPIITIIWKQFNKKKIHISVPIKLFIGIILAALGIGAFTIAADTQFVLTGVIVGILFLSAGELVITPSMYTAISDIAPAGMKSTMMGCWWLFVALGGYISGLLANLSNIMILHFNTHNAGYYDEFMFITVFTILIAVILLVCTPKLLRMIS